MRKPLSCRLGAVLVLAALSLVTGCQAAATAGDSKPPVSGAKTVGSVLTALGVAAYANPPAARYQRPNGQSVDVDPATWQPYRTPSAVFGPQAELLELGGNTPTGGLIGLVENGGVLPVGYLQSDLSAGPDSTWLTNSYKTAVSADIDGDGLQETVLFYVKITDTSKVYFRVYRQGVLSGERLVQANGAPLVLQGAAGQNGSFSRLGSGMGIYWYPRWNSGKGRFTADGRETLFLIEKDTVFQVVVQATSATTYSATVASRKKFPADVTSVASGDPTGARKDMFVVGMAGSSSGAAYGLYQGDEQRDFQHPLMNPEFATADPSGLAVEATWGDLQGSGHDQLVLAWVDHNGYDDYGIRTVSAAGVQTSIATSHSSPLNTIGQKNSTSDDDYRLLPRVADIAGTGKGALMVLGNIYLTPLETDAGLRTIDSIVAATDGLLLDDSYTDVQVGDAEGDGKPDFYVVTATGGQIRATILGFNSGGSLVRKIQWAWSTHGYGLANQAPVAVGNFHDTAPRVTYVGHALTFSNPVVLAVLSAAPSFTDVTSADPTYAGSLGNWMTTYGYSTSSGTGSSSTIGFSVGDKVELEQEVSIFGVEAAKFQQTFSRSVSTSWEWSTELQQTKSITMSTPAIQDSVVFIAIPIDRFDYRVVADPIGHAEGKILSINLPRTFEPQFVSREFYNEAVAGTGIPTIDAAVIGHTVGSPFSYPTKAQRDATMADAFPGDSAAAAAFQIGPNGVGQGVNQSGLQIDTSMTYTKTLSQDLSVEAEVGGGAGGVIYLKTAGFNVGYSASTTVSSGKTFAGTVGSLPTKYYLNPAYRYSSGLFAYPHQGGGGPSYWIVDYWVE